jgi:hypothetical protein
MLKSLTKVVQFLSAVIFEPTIIAFVKPAVLLHCPARIPLCVPLAELYIPPPTNDARPNDLLPYPPPMVV